MKKRKSLIILLCVFFLVIVSAAALHFFNESLVDDVFQGENIEGDVDDYLISQGREVAAGKYNAVIIRENYDFPFEAEGEEFIFALDYIETSVFDRIYIESEYFSSGEGSYRENLSKISAVSKALREKDKKIFIQIKSSFDGFVYKALSEFCDGFIVTCDEGEDIIEALSYVRKNTAEDKEIIAFFSPDADPERLEKESCDGVLVFIKSESDIEKIRKWDILLAEKGISLSCGFDLDGAMKKETSPSHALDMLYALSEIKSLETRCISTYKAVRKNYQNSFSAFKKYITKGIVSDIAFRQLGITGYEGETLSTKSLTAEFELCGSDLFPVYLDGEKISLGEKGSKKITLDLEIGENVFTFKQNGKKLQYKVNLEFDSDIIRAVFPAEEVTAYPGEQLNIMIIAYSKADVSVKIGTKEYKAYCDDSSQSGYSAFLVSVKMPSTYEEVSSLGMITVIGSVGEKSVQKKGAMIKAAQPAEEKPTENIQTEITDESTTGIRLENFVPELEYDEYEYTTQPTTQGNTIFTPFVGDQMCIITAPYADTRPVFYNDDTFDPSYSTLVAGTVDYVESEAEIYNDDEGEYFTYYELSSGRRVKADHAQLIARKDMGKNSLKVLSSLSENGTLKIKLDTLWKVPYAITHTPQNYFNAYTKKYNISAFTADYIEIVFYHTSSVSGNVNTSGSNVISIAHFSASDKDDTVTLRMNLSAFGKYYGCSVEYDANGDLVITVHNNPQSLNQVVILLDAGHGGKDSGALGIGEQVKESDVNIALTYAVRDTLRQMGATVYLTRQGNESLSIDERKNIVYSIKPDLFVSIHCNGSPKSSDIGTSVYYYKGFSLNLANNIYNQLSSVFKNNLYSGRQELYNQICDGTRYYPFGVLRVEDCPSVLIETGYMTNDEECYKLIQSGNIQLLGKAIAEGIAKTVAE